MYEYEAVALAIVEERIREADHQRLVRSVQRRERPATVRTGSQGSARPSRLWSLAHFHRAYG